MEHYIRKALYYETDKMTFVHHSNYIRWFEEARLDYLDKAGVSYPRLEEEGLLSPVMSMECQYLKPVKFADVVEIDVKLVKMRTLKFDFEYKVTNVKTGELCAMGKSSHCFIKADGTPVSLKTYHPDLYDKLEAYEKTREE